MKEHKIKLKYRKQPPQQMLHAGAQSTHTAYDSKPQTLSYTHTHISSATCKI